MSHENTAHENPMPNIVVHLVGLAVACLLCWACYLAWQMLPKYIGPTLFNDMRIVLALIAAFLILSIAQIALKAIARLATPKKT